MFSFLFLSHLKNIVIKNMVVVIYLKIFLILFKKIVDSNVFRKLYQIFYYQLLRNTR